MFRVAVSTEDGSEYTLDRDFDTLEEAQAELDDIIFGEPSYLDGSMIECGNVEEV